jgi:hypothetical protein
MRKLFRALAEMMNAKPVVAYTNVFIGPGADGETWCYWLAIFDAPPAANGARRYYACDRAYARRGDNLHEVDVNFYRNKDGTKRMFGVWQIIDLSLQFEGKTPCAGLDPAIPEKNPYARHYTAVFVKEMNESDWLLERWEHVKRTRIENRHLHGKPLPDLHN